MALATDSHLALVSSTTLIGSLLGLLAARVAARRAAAQPVDQDAAAERALLGALATEPLEAFRTMDALSRDDFADPALGDVYDEIMTNVRAHLSSYLPDPSTPATDELVEAAIISAGSDETALAAVHTALAPVAVRFPAPEVLPKAANPVLHFGSIVLGHASSRAQNTSRSPLVLTEGVITREVVPASPLRQTLSALVGGLSAGLLAVALTHLTHEPMLALVLGCLAGLVTVFSSVEFSLVDFDTYYLDTPVFWPTALLAWALAVLAALASSSPSRLLAGAILAGAIALAFEGLARAFALLRGHTQGAGDTWIIVLTAGVPAGLLGSWRLGLYGLLAGCITAIIEWIIRRVRDGATTETPLAFGPHLAGGWVIILAAAALVGKI